MVTCPWCGTSHTQFQPNCSNCGGPLPVPPAAQGPTSSPGHAPAAHDSNAIPVPPPPPRPVPNSYAWKLLTSDGWAITAFVFALLGGIFFVTGGGLTLGIITAFVGIPMALLGLLFLGGAIGVGYWRYKEARKIVDVLQVGVPVEGRVLQVEENTNVQVNGRNPWTISYTFPANGQEHQGSVTTLSFLHPDIEPETRVCVLYLPQSPEISTLYPHP